MISFNNYLQEVFDRPAAFSLLRAKPEDGLWRYRIFANRKDDYDETYTVIIMINYDKHLDGYEVSVSFHSDQRRGDKGMFDLTGNNTAQFKLFATFYSILNNLKKEGYIKPGMYISSEGWTSTHTAGYQTVLNYFTKKGLVEKAFGDYWKFK